MSIVSVYIAEQVFFLAGAIFALWKGGAAERFAAIVVIANFLISTGTSWFLHEGQGTVQLAHDGLAAIALLVITIRYGALWMGAVMLLYAVLFTLNSFYLVTERPSDYLFLVVNNMSWLAIICCLMAGAAVAWRRRVRPQPPLPAS